MTERTGKDGVLRVSIPLGIPEAVFEVVLVVQPRSPEIVSTTTEEGAWPPGFFDLAGSIDDPTFQRPPQGELPNPAELN